MTKLSAEGPKHRSLGNPAAGASEETLETNCEPPGGDAVDAD